MRAAPAALACLSVAAAAGLWACGEGGKGVSDTARTARERAASFFRPPNDRIPSSLATNPGTPWGDYVGSKRCQSCHEEEYADWRNSYHSKTLYDAVPATVFGRFDGDASFRDQHAAFTARPFRSGDKMFMEVRRNAEWKPLPDRTDEDTYGFGVPQPAEGTWEILYAFGNRRHQPYVARARDGRHWVLPFFWNDVTKAWHYNGWRPWVRACAGCHVTGIKTLSSPEPGSVLMGGLLKEPRYLPAPAHEGWAEGAVSCEVCHGPGRGHSELAERLGDEGYWAYRADAKNPPTIYCPSEATPEVRMNQCDLCHNFHAESQVTYVPGPHGYDHEMMKAPLQPKKDPRLFQFYADGTDKSPCTVGRVFRGSKMGQAGIECRDCHHSHGNANWADLLRPLEGNKICVDCHLGNHAEFRDPKVLEAHTRHRADGPGSSCAECHMRRDKRFTDGWEIMSDLIYSHDFGTPNGHESPMGPGPSCNVCHTDRDAAWTRETLERWRRERPSPPEPAAPR